MTAGDWIALYAAAVGTAALAWQAVTYLEGRRPKLRVQMMLIHFVTTLEQSSDPAEELIAGEWRLDIEVLNLGRSQVRISRVTIETNRTSSGVEAWTSSSWGLPWLLEPAEQRAVFLTDDHAGRLTSGQDLTAAVTTTTGERFVSETLHVGEPGPVHELVMLEEERFRGLLSRVPDADEKRFYTYRVAEFGDPAEDA